MVADACLPFSLVHNVAFRAYSHKLYPLFPVQDQWTVQKSIVLLYECGIQGLKFKFEFKGVWNIMLSIIV